MADNPLGGTDVATDSAIPRTRAIGVPGSQQFDPTTGEPIGGTYQGFYATPPAAPLGTWTPPEGGPTYQLTYPDEYVNRQVQPRYYEGDQWVPASMGIEDMKRLQLGLEAAGLYTDDYTIGVWDISDVNVYERLLAMSNSAGVDQQEMLKRKIANPSTKKGPKRAPLVIKLTNPADLKKTLQQVSRDLYGGNLPDEDQERFVQAYQGLESGASQAAYAAGEAGGTFTAPPDPGVAAENQIRAEHPLEVRNQGFVNNLDQVLSTFMKRLPGGGAT